jgi:hypothetical protein
MTLPDACEKCAPYAGRFMETDAGLKRCDCARGRALATMKTPVKPQTFIPQISTECATVHADMMSALPFFPSSGGALTAVGIEIRSMCRSEEDALWLARRMNSLFDHWPGIAEMRRVYCDSDKWPPLDGIAAIGASEIYPDGFPSEHPEETPLQLPAARDRAISAAPSIQDTIDDLTVKTDLNKYGATPPRVREIPLKPLPPPLTEEQRRVLREQMQQAEKEYREAKAREELEGRNDGPNNSAKTE